MNKRAREIILTDLIRINTEVKEELSDSILARMNSFKGLQLQDCFRKYYDDHGDFDSNDNLDQELDGDTFIVFSDKTVIGFYAHSEAFSLKIDFSATLENTVATNVSGNLFWKNKIGNDVVDIQLLYSEYRSNPYGVKFILSNDTCFEIVYVSESDYTFDAVVIRDRVL